MAEDAGKRPEEAHEVLASAKWVRVLVQGVYVADSRDVRLLRGAGRPPIYFFPPEDVRVDLHEERGKGRDPALGETRFYALTIGERRVDRAAWSHLEPPDLPELAGRIAFVWDEMDAWFEEDEEVYVHARDPRIRVDVCQSSRHVRIEVGGETIADSRRPVLLFETGLPVRYYLPKQDVRLDRLVPTDSLTRCPYKGEARYYAVKAGGERRDDVAWWYPFPTTECARIAGLLAFYPERVDRFEVDGVAWEGPGASPRR